MSGSKIAWKRMPMKFNSVLIISLFLLTTIIHNYAFGQNRVHYYPQLPDSMAQIEKINNDKICSYTKMLASKNNIHQSMIDSLLSLMTQTERVCVRDSVAYKLFDRWVALGKTDKKMIIFFLKLERVFLRNVEFSEGRYEYVVRIAMENPELVASVWDSLSLELKGALLNSLKQESNIISSWESLSSAEKKDQSINYVHDITLGLPWNVVLEESRVAFLDSISNINDNRIKALREKLLDIDMK